jgi:hypothetical protein
MAKEYQSTCVIRPATLGDLPSFLDDLLDNCVMEHYRAGTNPALAVSKDMLTYNTQLALSPDGKPMVLYGINSHGNMWMQMTNEINKHPRAFVRATLDWLKKNKPRFLYNYIDIQNTTLLRFFKKLGCKFIRVVPKTMNNIYYVEVVKVWN